MLTFKFHCMYQLVALVSTLGVAVGGLFLAEIQQVPLLSFLWTGDY